MLNAVWYNTREPGFSQEWLARSLQRLMRGMIRQPIGERAGICKRNEDAKTILCEELAILRYSGLRNILGGLSTHNAHDLTNDLMRIKILKNSFNLNRQSQSASRICTSACNLSSGKLNQWRLSDLHPQSLIEWSSGRVNNVKR